MNEIKKPAIVMPVYNSGKSLIAAIDSIQSSTNNYSRIILVESGSTDGSDKVCDTYAKINKRTTVIHQKERKGATNAVNTGIKEAGELDVFLTQTDVLFPKKYESDWLFEMEQTARHNKDCGLVTGFAGGGTSGEDYLDKFVWVGTWCMYVPRSTFNKIGLFDEMYCGPGDDIDFCYAIKNAGLMYYMINYWVDHHRKVEFHTPKDEVKGELITDKIDNNGQLFKKKWGLLK